jgi:hypothetical protein
MTSFLRKPSATRRRSERLLALTVARLERTALGLESPDGTRAQQELSGGRVLVSGRVTKRPTKAMRQHTFPATQPPIARWLSSFPKDDERLANQRNWHTACTANVQAEPSTHSELTGRDDVAR